MHIDATSFAKIILPECIWDLKYRLKKFGLEGTSTSREASKYNDLITMQ